MDNAQLGQALKIPLGKEKRIGVGLLRYGLGDPRGVAPCAEWYYDHVAGNGWALYYDNGVFRTPVNLSFWMGLTPANCMDFRMWELAHRALEQR